MRDYSLSETELARDAVKLDSFYIKDYSMQHLCKVLWKQTEHDIEHRIVHLVFDDKFVAVNGPYLKGVLEDLVEQEEEDKLPREEIVIEAINGRIIIETKSVNEECLKDRILSITLKKRTALIDLEELIKAIRYA